MKSKFDMLFESVMKDHEFKFLASMPMGIIENSDGTRSVKGKKMLVTVNEYKKLAGMPVNEDIGVMQKHYDKGDLGGVKNLGQDSDAIIKKSNSYVSTVKNRWTNIVMEEYYISEKDFNKLEKLTDYWNHVVYPRYEKLINEYEQQKARPAYTAEHIWMGILTDKPDQSSMLNALKETLGIPVIIDDEIIEKDVAEEKVNIPDGDYKDCLRSGYVIQIPNIGITFEKKNHIATKSGIRGTDRHCHIRIHDGIVDIIHDKR